MFRIDPLHYRAVLVLASSCLCLPSSCSCVPRGSSTCRVGLQSNRWWHAVIAVHAARDERGCAVWQQDGAAVVASEKEPLNLLTGGDETKATDEKKADKVQCDACVVSLA